MRIKATLPISIGYWESRRALRFRTDPASVRVGGIMAEPSWTWDLDKFIYLGVNGLLTQTPPGTGFLLEMGWPINPTSMMVDIKLPLFLA